MPKKANPEKERTAEIPSRVERATRKQIALPLTEDSSGIHWDGLRESTRKKLGELIGNDPAAMQRMGLATTGATEEQPQLDLDITQENVGAALDAVNTLTSLGFAWAFPKVTKHPFKKLPTGKPAPFQIDPDLLRSAFTLTEEQHKELDPRALRIAKKHSEKLPEWLKKNFDLYALLVMFLKASAENGQNAIKMQFNRDFLIAQRFAAQRAAGATPTDTDVPSAPPPQPTNGADHTQEQP